MITLTFDREIFVEGLTGIQLVGAAANEISAVKTGSNVVEVSYDAAVIAATAVSWPGYMSAIRTVDGGFGQVGSAPITP